ncbi:unnamed protein product, partial [marine sediment metagenome]
MPPTQNGATAQGFSTDGATVVFFTSDALAPEDVNGDVDLYAYSAGVTTLISSGKTGPLSCIEDDECVYFEAMSDDARH